MLQGAALFGNVAAMGAVPVFALNPSDKAAAITLSNSNRTATISGTSNAAVRSVTSHTTGKYHFEATMNVSAAGNTEGIGVVPSTFGLTDVARFASPGGFYAASGYVDENGGGGVNADAWTVGDTVVFEPDLDTDQFWVEKVGGTGRKGPFTMGSIAATFAVVGLTNDTDQITVNFGQAAWAKTPTAGFEAPWG